MSNIVSESADVNLDALAAEVRSEIKAVQVAGAAVQVAGAAVLHHAMNAGDRLIEAQKHVTSGWKRWLKENCNMLSVRTAMVYTQLARHRAALEAEIDRRGYLSLRAAIKLVAAPSPHSTKTRTPTPLSISAWQAATAEQRQKFAAAIGLVSFLAAIPQEWRDDIKRRVAGMDARGANPISDVIAKALRQALSAQKISQKGKDVPAVGVANALNAINNKLKSVGLDLNDIEVVIRAPAAKRAA
jgi:hypothetical protein